MGFLRSRRRKSSAVIKNQVEPILEQAMSDLGTSLGNRVYREGMPQLVADFEASGLPSFSEAETLTEIVDDSRDFSPDRETSLLYYVANSPPRDMLFTRSARLGQLELLYSTYEQKSVGLAEVEPKMDDILTSRYLWHNIQLLDHGNLTSPDLTLHQVGSELEVDNGSAIDIGLLMQSASLGSGTSLDEKGERFQGTFSERDTVTPQQVYEAVVEYMA